MRCERVNPASTAITQARMIPGASAFLSQIRFMVILPFDPAQRLGPMCPRPSRMLPSPEGPSIADDSQATDGAKLAESA